jgi:hypothetical protein
MPTPGRGQVWTSEQLSARLTALRGLVPAAVQHPIYRATIDATAYAHEGYEVPGEARRLSAEAFDFWLAKRGLAGPDRLSVAVLVIRERLAADGNIQDCELEYRRGAVDGPFHGSPARIVFTGPGRLARFYQATPEGGLAEVAPTPGTPARPDTETDTAAAMRLAVQACCGEAVRILDTREPTVIEAMVGFTSVLHTVQANEREASCGIIWHGPTAVALQADFPRFDVEPTLSTDQSNALEALAAAEQLVVCETRRDEQGLGVLGRRHTTGELLLVRFDGETATLSPYVPGQPTEVTADQEQWLHYIGTYEGLRVLDGYHDGTSGALIVLTGAANGAAWRHHVDIDGIETWRRPDSGSATATLYAERPRDGSSDDLSDPQSAPPSDDLSDDPWDARGDDPSQAGRPAAPTTPDPPPGAFGPEVEMQFPSAAYDIDEAAQCLALRRSTAAVFHCLGVLEQGLRAHARWRGVLDPPAQVGQRWPSILGDLRSQGCDSAFFAAIDAVRRAWRGATLQVGPKYTEEEAERIVRLVEALMRCLAARCDEDGIPVAPADGKTG